MLLVEKTKENKLLKILKPIASFTLWVFIYAFILFFFTYSIQRGSIQETIYVLKTVAAANIYYIVVSYLIMLALLFISKAIFKNTFLSNLVVTILTVIIAIISYYKNSILNQPFVPTDVLLIGNADQIAAFGLSLPTLNMIYSIVVLAMILFLQFVVEKKYNINYKFENWKKELYRIPLFIIGIVIIIYTCINPQRFANFKIKNDLGDLYSYSGGNTTFFMHLGDFYFKTPEGYSEKKIEEIKEEYTEKNNDYMTNKDNNLVNAISQEKNINITDNIINKATDRASDKVNVILIMNESFSDPTKIKNVNYSIDPLKDLRELAKKDSNCKIGNLVSPVVGGGTSLPEFEVLTGLSSFYLEKQIYPYTSYITSDMNSIVREYNKNGYETLGLHTNTRTFYNRTNVYKYLGFEETIFSEDIENPETKGGFISDNEFKNQIINKFDSTKGENKFIFGVTMQNHMPYGKKVYETYDINITSDKYTETELKSLTNYVQGIYDSCKMYIELVNYLKEYDEPTILVMFGDHLPSLERNMYYKDSEYKFIDMYTTPYIIWSNYGQELSDVSSTITPSKLGLNLYNLSGNELPWYLKPFDELYEEYIVFNNNIVYNNDGEVITKEELNNRELVQKCGILQYEMLIKRKNLR